MRKCYLLCIVLIARCVSAQDAPPVDAKALLSSLSELKKKHDQSAKTMDGKVLRDFMAAGANNGTAIAFYQDAIRATSFVGQSREQTEFHEWKKQMADTLKSVELQTAVRFHLNYLVISLQRAQGGTVPQLLPALIAYTDQVTQSGNISSRQDPLRKSIEDMLKKSIAESIFAKWYGTTKYLQDLKEWETIPGNCEGIWQKVILPQLRKDKDQRAVQYWDTKLQREAQSASASDLTFYVEQFNNMRKPELLWSRAQDVLAIGHRNQAINEMAAILKGWPDHPRFNEWTTQLVGIVTGKDAGAAPSAPSENSQ